MLPPPSFLASSHSLPTRQFVHRLRVCERTPSYTHDVCRCDDTALVVNACMRTYNLIVSITHASTQDLPCLCPDLPKLIVRTLVRDLAKNAVGVVHMGEA